MKKVVMVLVLVSFLSFQLLGCVATTMPVRGVAVQQNHYSWKKSGIWQGNQNGPQDMAGLSWSDYYFDDSSWTYVNLPDSGPDNTQNDRYYRATFNWDGMSSLILHFASDDGLAVYINGNFLGSWGQGWRNSGCVNMAMCGSNLLVPDQLIPESMLYVGSNVIAVDLWNNDCCGYSIDLQLGRAR